MIVSVVAIGAYKTLTLPADERYTGDDVEELHRPGSTQGAIIGLIALGYTLVYGILRMINFAHGEVFMFGAFGAALLRRRVGGERLLDSNPLLSMGLLLVIAMLTPMGVAVLLERIAYRPLRNAPRLVPLITAIGASLFLANTARGFFGAQSRGVRGPDGARGHLIDPRRRGRLIQVVVLLTVIIAVTALSLFVSRTTTGKSMRAVAADSEIATIIRGLRDRHDVRDRLAGGHRSRAVRDDVRVGELHDGVPSVISAAFTAAVLGGIGSISGAALGGVLLDSSSRWDLR